jgi:hypothetical protein
MQRSDRLEQTTAVADRADAEVFRSSAVRLGSTVPSISLSRNTGPYCQSPSPRSHPAISMRGSVILPKRASSPSTKAGGVPPRPRGGVAGVPLTPTLSPQASEGPEALVDRTDTPSFGQKEPAVAAAEYLLAMACGAAARIPAPSTVAPA